jgi:hypothetical protein
LTEKRAKTYSRSVTNEVTGGAFPKSGGFGELPYIWIFF